MSDETQTCIPCSHRPRPPHSCPPTSVKPEPCPPDPCHPSQNTCAKQRFVLSDGVNVKVNCGQEVNRDFTLAPNPFEEFGTISGFVKGPSGHPIHHALVKVFDCNHKPFAHVFTNHEGQFLLCVPPGHYVLKAVK